MKRIVQCPKCETKLSVFDSGKPINQKCPKCRESFVIASEEAKAVAPEKPIPSATLAQPEVKIEKAADPKVEAKTGPKEETKPEAKAEVKADSKAEVKPETKADAKTDAQPDTKAAVSKEIAGAKPIVKPAASAQPKPSTVSGTVTPVTSHAECGISFGEVMVIMALLIFSLIIQVIGIRKNAIRFNQLQDQVQSLQSQLSTLKR